uniref:cold shock domain-containing protein n=1 Tax=Candidatus Electronema sp. TaxID=2698783 RepID=UPI004056BD4C
MDNSRRYEGKLVRWNEEKGFGFIQSENRGKDIFLHISALKNMSRRPVVGDIIFYRLHVEKDGKLKAVDAKIQGVSSILPTKGVNTRKNQSSAPYVLIFLAVFVFAGYFFYGKANFQSIQNLSFADSTESIPSSSAQKYSCQGKVHCSEMTSCEEATFYVQNCPGT